MRSLQSLLVAAAVLVVKLSVTIATEPSPNQPLNPSPNNQQPGASRMFAIPEKFPGTDKKLIKEHEMRPQVKLLLSRKPEEVQAAEKWFEREHDTLIAQFELVDPTFQKQILHALCYWISPWQRNTLARRHWIPVRPIARPFDHPLAGKYRTLLLAIIANVDKLPVGTAEKELTWDQHQEWSVYHTAVEYLAEFADPATAKHMRIALSNEQTGRGRVYMDCLERIYGLPEQHPAPLRCGLGLETFEARQRLAEQNRIKYYEPGKKKLLAWLDEYAEQSETNRCRAALTAWEKHFESSDLGSMLTSYSPGYHPIYRLTRLGPPLVPVLRERQKQTDSLLQQGAYEFVIATITGNTDERLVRELLSVEHLSKKVDAAGNEVSEQQKSYDREFYQLGLQIIQAANAKGYSPELAAMLKDDRYYQAYVVRTLSAVYRADALPLLRTAPKQNTEAWSAIWNLENPEE